MVQRNAYQLLQEVRKAYSGAMEVFVISRLSLKTGLDLTELDPNDSDPVKAESLQKAIKEICWEVRL